jgi:hypothetical protein
LEVESGSDETQETSEDRVRNAHLQALKKARQKFDKPQKSAPDDPQAELDDEQQMSDEVTCELLN